MECGIGIPSPESKLDVAGDINTETQFNINGDPVLSVIGAENTFAGVGSPEGKALSSSSGSRAVDVIEVNEHGKIQTIRAYWNPVEMIVQL